MNEKNKKYIFWGILSILALFLFYLLSGGGLSSDSSRTDRAGEHLNRTGEYQQRAIQRIDHIEAESSSIQREIGEAADQIGRVEHRIEDHQSRLESSNGLLGRGQEIIQRIRKRGTIETEKNNFTEK